MQKRSTMPDYEICEQSGEVGQKDKSGDAIITFQMENNLKKQLQASFSAHGRSSFNISEARVYADVCNEDIKEIDAV